MKNTVYPSINDCPVCENRLSETLEYYFCHNCGFSLDKNNKEKAPEKTVLIEF